MAVLVGVTLISRPGVKTANESPAALQRSYRIFPRSIARHALAGAFVVTVAMSVPMTSMLAPAALLAPKRLKSITLRASVGSALGAAALVVAFHHLGWVQIHHLFRAMLESASCQQVILWTRDWGVLELFTVALMPLPQTPALTFGAFPRLPEAEVMLAILAGKLMRCRMVAAMVFCFQERSAEL